MSAVATIEQSEIGREDNGRLMTPEEFDAIEHYDDFYRYELINGVLIVSPMAGPGERDPNEELGHWLREYQEDHPGIIDKTLFEEYIRTGDNRRRADRVIWTGLGRLPNVKVDVPSIVVEFVSKDKRGRQRDYVAKREEYLNVGVQEYWIIDRFLRKMTVCRRENERIDENIIGENESYSTSLLPSFHLTLKDLLGLADIWTDADSEDYVA
jgi:Uma2 family endonuclease